jgi:hypothetical protein
VDGSEKTLLVRHWQRLGQEGAQMLAVAAASMGMIE